MPIEQDALDYHARGRPGKLAIRATKPLETQRDLALAYSPGVAAPCLEIAENPEAVFKYTARGNLVAVVSNGTAVLGLGNIGPEASKPVMEGKAVLFKRFADIDVFDLEIAERDPDRIIELVAALEPTFGAINLEDIKAPECFYIEEKLRARMQIPVFHDDQHGTAIIAAAALINGLHLQGKAIGAVDFVFSGAGAAAIACAELMVTLGADRSRMHMCDSRGVIYAGRTAGMNPYKARFAVETQRRTLGEAMVDADVFVGVSVKDVVTPEMITSMAPRPVVMAMANPDPEIAYELAMALRDDMIMGTGRSDYPNQVNNVLGFPFIFRGALDVGARSINDAMKVAAVWALAELAREEVPEDVVRAYGDKPIHFGAEYIIPKPFDRRALMRVAPAVAQAAMDSGVARLPIADMDAYRDQLERLLGRGREVMRQVIRRAARRPKRLAFANGAHPKILRAAQICVEEGICHPILVGTRTDIEREAAAHEIDPSQFEIVDHRSDPRAERFAEALWRQRQRRGMTLAEARRQLDQSTVFAAMMVNTGEADSLLTGLLRSYPDSLRTMLQVIEPCPDHCVVTGAHLVILRDSVKVFADTTVNIEPSAEVLAEVAMSAAAMARRFDLEPRVALLSFSNFGSNDTKSANKVRQATQLLAEKQPDFEFDGEMQLAAAINVAHRDELFPFCKLTGEANVLVFPCLSSANIGYKLMTHFAEAEVVGPILTGLRRPANILERDTSVRAIVNMAAVTVVQAQRASEGAA
jgi:malate dehydrogenase (oxaloacetate-decarboxylating)(NADP+)